jgi:hypothetical protein
MARAARPGKLPTGKLGTDKLSTGKLSRRGPNRLPVSSLFTLAVLAWRPNSRIGPGMSPSPSDDQPTVCVLAHRGFVLMGAPLFRRAETDATPVMVVTLGERQVSVPLRALQREFAIVDDAPDGRMLALIVEALEFVSALRIGDPLPREVCTGEASWEPDAMHLALASMRLRMQLVAWVNAGVAVDAPQMTDDALLRLGDDPVVRRQVQEALDHAAAALGLPNREAVIELLEDLAHELAFIEALRDRLLHRVQAMVQKVAHMAQSLRGDAPQMDTLTQVRRLSLLALKQFARKFDELDANTGEVMAALRNANSQRTFIRSSRDFLYRSLRAWQPILDEWGAAGSDLDDGARELLGRTYQFLAPRYMPVTEWLSPTRPERTKAPVRQMTW